MDDSSHNEGFGDTLVKPYTNGVMGLAEKNVAEYLESDDYFLTDKALSGKLGGWKERRDAKVHKAKRGSHNELGRLLAQLTGVHWNLSGEIKSPVDLLILTDYLQSKKPKIEKLSLADNNLSAPEVTTLITILKDFPHLAALDLRGNILDQITIDRLFELAKQNQRFIEVRIDAASYLNIHSLQEQLESNKFRKWLSQLTENDWDLSGRVKDQVTLNVLKSYLKTENPWIERLILADNGLDATEITLLLAVLKDCSQLVSLDLRGNSLNHDALAILLDIAKQNHRFVELLRDPITDNSVRELDDHIAANKLRKTLPNLTETFWDLSGKIKGAASINVLSHYLKTEKPRLEELILTNNALLPKELLPLIKALKGSHQLVSFNLRGNYLNQLVIDALSELADRHGRFTELRFDYEASLSSEQLEDQIAANKLRKLLPQLVKSYWDLSGKLKGPVCLAALKNYLEAEKPRLEELSIAGNGLKANDMVELASILQFNHQLVALDLRGNYLDQHVLTALNHLVAQNYELTEIRLDKSENLNDKDFNDLIEANKLRKLLPQLTSIHWDLSGKIIGIASIQVLSHFIQTEKPWFKDLSVANNKLSTQEVQALVKALKSFSYLSSLDLRGNNLDTAAIKELIQLAQSNPLLTELRIDIFPRLNTKDLVDQIAANQFKECIPQLVGPTWDLTGKIKGSIALQLLVTYMQKSNTDLLEKINIGANDLRGEEIVSLVSAFKQYPNLKEIDLTSSMIDKKGLMAFESLITNNLQLVNINLEKISLEDVSPEMLKKVKEKIQLNRKIPHLLNPNTLVQYAVQAVLDNQLDSLKIIVNWDKHQKPKHNKLPSTSAKNMTVLPRSVRFHKLFEQKLLPVEYQEHYLDLLERGVLDEVGIDLTNQSEIAHNLLKSAFDAQHSESLKILLEAGADPLNSYSDISLFERMLQFIQTHKQISDCCQQIIRFIADKLVDGPYGEYLQPLIKPVDGYLQGPVLSGLRKTLLLQLVAGI